LNPAIPNPYGLSELELTLIAFHEAGHAVAAELRHPGSAGTVTIISNSDYGTLGYAHTGTANHADVFVLFAGVFAESQEQWRLDGGENNELSLDDYIEMNRESLKDSYELGDDHNDWYPAINEILREQEFCNAQGNTRTDLIRQWSEELTHQWQAIDMLAKALLEYGKSSGKQVADIVEIVS
jgi:hypothetical protein